MQFLGRTVGPFQILGGKSQKTKIHKHVFCRMEVVQKGLSNMATMLKQNKTAFRRHSNALNGSSLSVDFT